MSKKITTSIVCAAAAFAFVASANAADITWNGLGLNKSINYVLDGSNKSVPAGEMLISIEDVDYTAYCVDLRHTVKSNWDASLVTIDTLIGGRAAAFLYDTFSSTVTTNEQAAGLQSAIWEVVEDFDDAIDLTAGSFRLTGSAGVIAAAQSFLSALPADLSTYTTSSVILQSGDGPRSQNLIVPEPATLALVGLVFPAVFARRSRRA